MRNSSSAKIQKMIETIIDLCAKDQSVKIIIYSQWSNILQAIGSALMDNQILFRSQLSKFHLTINEFKVNKKNSLSDLSFFS